VRIPDEQVADDERVPRVRADAADALAEIDGVMPGVRMAFVVVEADERQRADIDAFLRAVGLLDGEDERERLRRRRP
jgi:hypothetical protein